MDCVICVVCCELLRSELDDIHQLKKARIIKGREENERKGKYHVCPLPELGEKWECRGRVKKGTEAMECWYAVLAYIALVMYRGKHWKPG